MTEPGSSPNTPDNLPKAPISTCFTASEALIRNRNLSPPSHPGLLASLDRFEILKIIGAGGMGLVFLARDPNNDTKVAVKLLKPDLATNDTAVRRFLKESRHMERLVHPNILPLLEVSEGKESYYFVTPYMEGGSLARLIAPGQPLPKASILNIALPIAHALQFAHSRGIIHRDLKPGNILLDKESKPFLMDFGLARSLFNDSMMDVSQGHYEGTAPYMSPAVAAGQAEDTRCDIYSFGALLYEMLTGSPPYEADCAQAILKKIREHPPKAIRDINPKADGGLVSIAERAMARTARDRYATMADVLSDLERVSHGQAPLLPRRHFGLPIPTGICKRPAYRAAAIAAVLIALAFVYFLSSKPRLVLKQQITSRQITDFTAARFGHWDSDRKLDLYVPSGPKWWVVKSFGQTVGPFEIQTPPDILTLTLTADVNDDGLDEAVVNWTIGTNCNLGIFNQVQFPVKTVSIPGRIIPHPATRPGLAAFRADKLADLDNDRSPELIAHVGTAWGPPRGLTCFRLADEKLRWNYPTAPFITETALLPLENGTMNVIAGSHSVCNGVKLPDGTEDHFSYIYAISSSGEHLWRNRVATGYARSYPFVTRSSQTNSKPLLYAWAEGNPHTRTLQGERELGQIWSLDPNTGHTNAFYDAGAWIQSCLPADLDQNGAPEIVAADRFGNAHVLDLNLRLEQKINLVPRLSDSVDWSLVAITNLTRDPSKQLVFLSSQLKVITNGDGGATLTNVVKMQYRDTKVLLFDEKLRPLASYLLASEHTQHGVYSLKIADMDSDGVPEIVALGPEVQVLHYEANHLAALAGTWTQTLSRFVTRPQPAEAH